MQAMAGTRRSGDGAATAGAGVAIALGVDGDVSDGLAVLCGGSDEGEDGGEGVHYGR
jgi:hypothetical protein